MHRLMLLFLATQVSQSQAPLVTAPPGTVVPDIKEENAISRLKTRNLFHPTRGVVLTNPTAAAPIEIPALVATVITKKTHAAMFRWPKATDAELVDQGVTQKGVVLLEVEADRAQIQIVASGEKRWLEFEQAQPSGGGSSRTGSELEQLLTPSKRATPPPAQPDQASQATGTHK